MKRSNTSVKKAGCPCDHLYPLCLQLFKVLFFPSSATQSFLSQFRLWKCWLQRSFQFDNPHPHLHRLVHGHHTPGTLLWRCLNLLTPGVLPSVCGLLTCFPSFWCLNPFLGSKSCSKLWLSHWSIMDLPIGVITTNKTKKRTFSLSRHSFLCFYF